MILHERVGWKAEAQSIRMGAEKRGADSCSGESTPPSSLASRGGGDAKAFGAARQPRCEARSQAAVFLPPSWSR
jgi:hypothetical protein